MSGAFVAGTKAGWAYNNFPLMGDNILPPVLINHDYSVLKVLNDLGFIQFFTNFGINHTSSSYISWFLFYKQRDNFSYNWIVEITSSLYIGSVLLGVLILKYYVPISWV